MNTRHLTLNYLQNLINRGESTLAVDQDARTVLRTWMIAARQGNSQTRLLAPEAAQTKALPASHGEAENKGVGFLSVDEIFQKGSTSQDAEEVFFRVPQGKTEERWNHFVNLLSRWQPLQDLGTLRNKLVLGEGKRDADIMFVGDAPGNKDEEEGRPFIGPAGEKLNGMLTAMGLSRSDIYLTHLVKFRPALPRQTINNRPPNAKEIELSAAVLDAEISLVQPRVIVALGVIAARGLLRLGDLPLAEYQSKPRLCGQIPVIVTHHPSYLLRTSDLAERRALWEEMLDVMERVNLPISDKQRQYFLPKQA